jgi:hypothetical protein
MADEGKNGNDSAADFKSFGSLFVQLVLSFHAAAWQQMGKVASVLTGKVERDLTMAKHSIDMLGMLEEKTRGNLSEDEQKYLEHTLYELRMNYLDELKKGPDKKEPETPGDKPKEDDADQSDDAGNDKDQ